MLKLSKREPQEKSSSSASEPSPSLIQCSFGDFLEILRTRGLDEKADSYLTIVTVECLLRQGTQDPLDLLLEDAIHIIENPIVASHLARLNQLTTKLQADMDGLLVGVSNFMLTSPGSDGRWDNEYMGSYLREMERKR